MDHDLEIYIGIEGRALHRPSSLNIVTLVSYTPTALMVSENEEDENVGYDTIFQTRHLAATF